VTILKNDFIAKKLSPLYAGWEQNVTQSILNGQQNLETLVRRTVINNLPTKHVSGRQEVLENTVN